MKVKTQLKVIIGALAFGLAGHAAALPIDNGATGNGQLWFSIANATQSYTRNLTMDLNTFDTSARTVSGFTFDWNADPTLQSFLAGVGNPSELTWNVMALDSSGERRLLTTFTAPQPLPPNQDTQVIRAAVGDAQQWVNGANEKLAVADSSTYTASDPGFANKTDALGRPFQPDIYQRLNFDTRATFGTGESALDVMRINAGAFGITQSTYTRYFDPNAVAIQFRLEQNGNLHVSAVPEPDTYALMIAGLGLIGFIARRRLTHTA